jgi:curved DNA-binding protein CbpA
MEPHELLGVARDAPLAALRKAYLVQAKLWHPDKRSADETKEEKASAQARFLDIQRAYQTLLDAATQKSRNFTEEEREPHKSKNFIERSRKAAQNLAAAKEQRETAQESYDLLLSAIKASEMKGTEHQAALASQRQRHEDMKRRHRDAGAEFREDERIRAHLKREYLELKRAEADRRKACEELQEMLAQVHTTFRFFQKQEYILQDQVDASVVCDKPYESVEPIIGIGPADEDKATPLDGPRRPIDHLGEAIQEMAYDFWKGITNPVSWLAAADDEEEENDRVVKAS